MTGLLFWPMLAVFGIIQTMYAIVQEYCDRVIFSMLLL